MKKLGMFAAGFALMMLAGIAAAQLGAAPTEGTSNTGYGVALDESSSLEEPDQARDQQTDEEPTPTPEGTAAQDDAAESDSRSAEEGNRNDSDEVDEPETDSTPPAFVILHPENGQTFETKEVAFEGEVEPGSRVYAGEYEAEVDERGNWRIVLWLEPGQNVATLRAVDAAGNESTASVSVFRETAEEPKSDDGAEPDKDRPGDEPEEEEPRKDEPGEDKPGDESDIEFSINQKRGVSDSPEPFEVFSGTGHPGLVIEFMSPYGDRRIEVGESGEWATELFFHEQPANETFEIVVETSDGHRKVFTFTWKAAEGE